MDAMMNNASLKLRAWWMREELDDRLAHGADPIADPLLAHRAAQLTSPETRVHVAEGLENALADARRTWSLTARLPLRRAEVRACADDILALIARMRDGRPIDVQGAAMAAQLVFDGISPMYRDGATTLRYAVRSARMALDPIEVVATDPALSRVA
jgi:hypothetical protein